MPKKELQDRVLNAPEYLTMRHWLEGEPVLPFAKIIETWGDDYRAFEEQRKLGGLPKIDIDQMVRRRMLRSLWIGAFGFAIPCAELLDEIAKHGKIVEIGAGTGYMTRLMRHRGIDVIGTDPHEGDHGFEAGKLDDKQVNYKGAEAVKRFRDRNVFCSWPTLHATWFHQALKAMQIGRKIIVIREEACADQAAWDYLDTSFEELAHVAIPVFEHVSDYAATYIKRKK